jgi:hypothetical protein
MRSFLVAVIGLVIGALGALAYSHYLGEGRQLAAANDQVNKFQADLTKAAGDTKLAKDENDALTSQVQQLITSKNQLQKQIDDAKSPAGPALPNLSGMFGGADMSGIIKAQASQRNRERLQMLISRLHLTPDQIAKIQAAMDNEDKRTEEMTAKMFSGQKVDFQSLVKSGQAFESVEQVIQDVLTPDQKTGYQQIQNDQKTSSAETMASFEMNQVAPLLNLSETQKDQVESALYQVQLDTQDPTWVQKNVGSVASNPTAIIDAQEKAKEDALATILTPDQMAAYRQQAQAQLNLQKTMIQKFMPAGMGAAAPAPPAANGAAAVVVPPSPPSQ